MSLSGQALFLSSKELDRLSILFCLNCLNILYLLRNEGVPSFRLCASLFLNFSGGRKEDVHHLLNESSLRLEGVGLLLEWCAVMFSSHRRSSTGDVPLSGRSHVACVSKKKKCEELKNVPVDAIKWRHSCLYCIQRDGVHLSC